MGVKHQVTDPISRARHLRKQSTEAEKLLWSNLRRHQLLGYQFRRQEPIGNYIVDFVCYQRRLVVELDGGHHQEQITYDNERTKTLESRGFRVIRFWNDDVLLNQEGVLAEILMLLE